MAKVVCVLYDDPVDGYPKSYAREIFPRSIIIPTARLCRRPKRSISSPGHCSAAYPANLACANISNRKATRWS